VLLKVVPHVKYWWDNFYEQKEIDEPLLFTVPLTWESFKDVINKQYYDVGSYDDDPYLGAEQNETTYL
jgi:hypothetical protein